MRQIVYFSTAADRQDAITIAGILAVSHEHNRREKITGLLVAGGHRYLQVIEGPTSVVEALIERIRQDPRHVGISVLVDRKVAKRTFDGWSMASLEEPKLGDYSTFGELVGRMRVEVTEQNLRDQLDCFERRFAVVPVASPWTLASTYDPDLAFDGRH